MRSAGITAQPILTAAGACSFSIRFRSASCPSTARGSTSFTSCLGSWYFRLEWPLRRCGRQLVRLRPKCSPARGGLLPLTASAFAVQGASPAAAGRSFTLASCGRSLASASY
eukprot:scaffold576_cov260-Pinguiococcus_pyrenoidosus.AAC.29